jgi:Ca-activated chloride channel family protein
METSALSFARPSWLLLLWLLPLGVALFWWAEQRRRAMLGRIVAPKLRALLAGSTSPGRRWFRAACVLGALGLLVVTLAGPRLGYDTLEVPHRGRDVIMAIDVSRSMLATDVAPTRLQRAKLFAEDLISELGGDRIGLVAFAGSAFLQAPLTLDHGAVLVAVDELDTDLIPKGGTNIAAAIRAAEDAFGKAEGFSRAIVIISDGEELDADGVAAARQAAANGIRIFTVGIGSEEGSEIPLGPGEFVRDASGKIVVTRLDVERMKEIAEITGGFYTLLNGDTVRLLATDGIGRMEAVEMSASASRRPIERYQWPLAGAIALLMLQGLVGERRRRPMAVAAALWLLSMPAAWGGLAAYEEGDYEEARRAFEARLQMEPAAPGLQLNAGAAAYRLQDYGKAAEYFSRATLAEDPALRSAAEYNLGNTLFRQGEGQQDKEKKITDWKDAIAKYEAALQTRPDYTEARENKERVEELLRQLEEEEQPEEEKPEDQEQNQEQDQEQKQDQEQDQEQQQDQQQQDQEQDSQEDQQQDQEQDQSGDEQQDQQQDQPQDQQQDGGGEQQDDQQEGGEGQQEPQDGQPGEEQKEDGQPDQPGDQQQEGQDQQEDEREGQQGEEKEDQDGKESEPRDDGRPSESRPEPGQSGEQPAPAPEPSGERKEGELRGAEGGSEGQPSEEALAAMEEEVEGRMSESQARALLRSLQGEEEQVDLRERQTFQDVSRDW